jgi:glycosyltransferase involved in cell wall biosynthesis
MENMGITKRISVLIPTYNRKVELEKAIRSILKNNFNDMEVIVYDNCSDDGTKEMVKNYESSKIDVIYYRQKENVGPLNNWRSAINVSKGKYIHWLWSDDWVEDDFYKLMYEAVNQESTDIVFCGVKTVSFEDNWEKHTFTYNKINIPSMKFLKEYIKGFKYPLSPAACLLKRDHCSSILNSFIVPDTKNINVNDYGTGYDALMIMECIFNSTNIALVNKQLVNFRFHNNSISVSESGLGNQTRYAHSRLSWVKKNNLGLWCARYDLLRLIFFRKFHEFIYYIFNKTLLNK